LEIFKNSSGGDLIAEVWAAIFNDSGKLT